MRAFASHPLLLPPLALTLLTDAKVNSIALPPDGRLSDHGYKKPLLFFRGLFSSFFSFYFSLQLRASPPDRPRPPSSVLNSPLQSSTHNTGPSSSQSLLTRHIVLYSFYILAGHLTSRRLSLLTVVVSFPRSSSTSLSPRYNRNGSSPSVLSARHSSSQRSIQGSCNRQPLPHLPGSWFAT